MVEAGLQPRPMSAEADNGKKPKSGFATTASGSRRVRRSISRKEKTVVFSNKKVYDFLRQVALVWLPAAATLYIFLAQTWFWGHTQQVVGTISAADTFLGAILHISSKSYAKQAGKSDGKLVIDDTDPEKQRVTLDFSDSDPHTLMLKDLVKLQVVKTEND